MQEIYSGFCPQDGRIPLDYARNEKCRVLLTSNGACSDLLTSYGACSEAKEKEGEGNDV